MVAKKIKYNLKKILLEDPIDPFGYGKNPHLPPDVADYSEPGEPEERGWDDEELEEGMSDDEWQDAKEAERLEKHPEKDTIKKIQKLTRLSDIEEEDVGPNYDPQLSGWEEMEKWSQEQEKADRKQAWKDLFKKTYKKEQEKKPVYDDPPEDDIIPIWNRFLPQTENNE